MELDKKKIRLDEVTVMRTILALLIVFMHSFTCYNGSWEQPVGYVDIPLYKWLARISFAFTLEAFVFISGYLFAFQQNNSNFTKGIIELFFNKLKRLILPSIIFSIFYFILFYSYKNIGNTIFSIINGCGHMWFLPMLFWCFIGGWLLEQTKIRDGWKMASLLCINLFWPFFLPFQINKAASYLFYFYGGYVVYKHSKNIKIVLTPKHLLWAWILFAAIFATLRPMRDILVYPEDASGIYKFAILISNKACQIVYASIGLMSFYCTAAYYTNYNKLKPFAVKLATYCFGIYLFQQFILQLLYFKTSFSVEVGPYLLPWIGFVIATITSYYLTALFLKTKAGKYLLG